MHLVLLSDTHMHHESLEIPSCDVLVHAGDFSRRGSRGEAERFLSWLGAQPARERLLVSGNHDRWAEKDPDAFRQMCEAHGIRHLVLESHHVQGVHFFGAPYTPRHDHWAFQAGQERLSQIWSVVPNDVDVLITHGPPLDVLDRTHRGMNIGCAALRARVQEVAPPLHVFGHVHEARGQSRSAGDRTLFLNVSNRDHPTPGMRAPVQVHYAPGTGVTSVA